MHIHISVMMSAVVIMVMMIIMMMNNIPTVQFVIFGEGKQSL